MFNLRKEALKLLMELKPQSKAISKTLLSVVINFRCACVIRSMVMCSLSVRPNVFLKMVRNFDGFIVILGNVDGYSLNEVQLIGMEGSHCISIRMNSFAHS